MADKRIEDAIAYAKTMVGKKPSDADLRAYLKGERLDPRKSAWCAAFLNATLRKAGIEPPKSQMASYYLEWGRPLDTTKDEIRRGDVGVMVVDKDNNPLPPTRDRVGSYGHAMLVTGVEETDGVKYYHTIEGDWGNKVVEGRRDARGMGDVAFQRPPAKPSARIRIMNRVIVD